MNLRDSVQKYINEGFSSANAVSKVCQDVILFKISKYNMSDKVTIKGGVVMMQLSKDKRRATQDLDMDFIKYSIDEKAVRAFIEKISDRDIKLTIKSINKLKHIDYQGQRIFLDITDNFNNTLDAKIDLGVHKYLDMKQENMYFDLNIIDGSVSLLANSKEQIFVEKLKSLLRFRITSTRYKDVFDLYYLINDKNFNKEKCLTYIDKLIFADNSIDVSNILDLYKILNKTLTNKKFQSRLDNANNNWLGLPVNDVINKILNYIENLEKIVV